MFGRLLCSILLTHLCLALSVSAQQPNKWTNPDGKEIIGDFVRLEGKALVLQLENGKEAKIPFASLSLESHLQALKLGRPEAFNKDPVKAPVEVEAAVLPFKLTTTSILNSPFESDPTIDSFLKTFTDEFNRGNYFVAWHMMPPKMQTDMSAFLSKQLLSLGPNAPGQIRKLLDKIESILAKKKDWLLDPEITKQEIPDAQKKEIDEVWPYVVAMLKDLSEPSIWDSKNFRPEGIPNFLASVLVNFQYLPKMSKNPELQKMTYKVISESGDRAEVEIAMPGQAAKVVQFQKVGKIWVVPEMMNGVRKMLDESAQTPTDPKVAQGFGFGLAMIMPVVDALDQAKSKEDFKKTLDKFGGQFMPAGGMPGASPGMPSGLPGFPGFPGIPGLTPPPPPGPGK